MNYALTKHSERKGRAVAEKVFKAVSPARQAEYKRTYDRLIERAKGRVYISGVHDNHHIIPSSLGGPNDKSNIAVLTYDEHFLAHWILIKITEGAAQNSMLYALNQMTRASSSNKNRIVARWQYALARQAQALAMSRRMRDLGDAHPMKDPVRAAKVGVKVRVYQKSLGDKHPSKRQKRRDELRDNWLGDNNPSKKLTKSELKARGERSANTTKERYGNDRPWQEEASRKLSETMKRTGRTVPQTPETIRKNAQIRKERGVHAGDNNPSRRMSTEKLLVRAQKAAQTRQISRKGWGDEHPFKRPEVAARISGENSCHAKAIINLTTNQIFGTIKDAGATYGTHPNNIGDACIGRSKTSRKCRWAYLNSPEGYTAAVALLKRKRLLESFA